MKKVPTGEQLWKTTSDIPSGGEMIYGKEVPKDVKDKYFKDNLNETLKDGGNFFDRNKEAIQDALRKLQRRKGK